VPVACSWSSTKALRRPALVSHAQGPGVSVDGNRGRHRRLLLPVAQGQGQRRRRCGRLWAASPCRAVSEALRALMAADGGVLPASRVARPASCLLPPASVIALNVLLCECARRSAGCNSRKRAAHAVAAYERGSVVLTLERTLERMRHPHLRQDHRRRGQSAASVPGAPNFPAAARGVGAGHARRTHD